MLRIVLLRLVLVHLDKALLAGVVGLFGLAIAGPLARARAVDRLLEGAAVDQAAIERHFAGAVTPPPRPPAALERAAIRLREAPPEPGPFPPWLAERRPAWVYEVQTRELLRTHASAPHDLVAQVAGAAVELAWQPGADNARVTVTYRVERRVADGEWEQLAAALEAPGWTDTSAPVARPLSYRVVALAARAPGLEDEAEPLPPEQARLACEPSPPVQVPRPVAVRLRDVWVAPELSDEAGWATLDVIGGGERRGLPRVAVGQPIGESGAVLVEVGLPRRASRFGGEVPTPWARIRWPEGDTEELEAPR